MTSAQNLPQPLSGNNWIMLFLVAVLFLGACTALKPVVDDKKDNGNGDLEEIVTDTKHTSDNTTNNSNRPPVSRPRKPRVIDWKNENSPKNPMNPNVIKGEDDTLSTDNLDSTLNSVEDSILTGELKSTYDIAIVMPFHTEKVAEAGGKMPSSSVRGLNFYEGALLALQQLSAEGVNLNVNVYDSKRNSAIIQGLIDNSSLSNADLVLGPVSSENLKLVAENVAKKGTPIVSLNLNPAIAEANPFYIQASPYYASHAKAVVKYISERYKAGRVVLMSPNNSSDINRYQYFHNANALMQGSLNAPRFQEYTVGDPSKKSYSFPDIQSYLSPGDTSVVIVTTSNQDYVSSLMRTLSLSRNRYPVVVFGMPRWMGFNKIDFQYYANLNLHVSTSTYIDAANPEAKIFKRTFYKEYGMPPTAEAYKGYDLMLYFGRLLQKYGTGFLNQLDQSPGQYLHSNFAFERVFSIPQNMGEGNFQIKQFENKYVNILRFKDFQFQKVNK